MVKQQPFLHCILFLLFSVLLFDCVVLAVPVQLYGINYNTRQGADWNPFKCKTYEQVQRDLTMLSRLTNRIRILSLADCGQGDLVLNVARDLGLKVWLGIWLAEDDESVFELEKATMIDFLDRGLITDNVLGISVGSESIYREDLTLLENLDYRQQIKDIFVRYNMPNFLVSVCDIAPIYEANPLLGESVDIAMVNSFPFWESVSIGASIDYLRRELSIIQRRATQQGKNVIIGETGWPSKGFIQGVGVASVSNQRQFFVDYYCFLDREQGWKYFYFTGIDNAWRQEQDPDNTIEGNWGMLYANLTIKSHFRDLNFACPNNPETVHSFAEIDWTIPPLPTAPPTPLSPTSCQAHVNCQSLSGNCCPTDTGLQLGCCSAPSQPMTGSPPTTNPTSNAPVSDPPTLSPETREPTTNPTAVPTDAPTMQPINAFPPTDEPTIALAPTTDPSTTSMPSTSRTNLTTNRPATVVPTTNPTIEQSTESPRTATATIKPAISEGTTFPPTPKVNPAPNGTASSSWSLSQRRVSAIVALVGAVGMLVL